MANFTEIGPATVKSGKVASLTAPPSHLSNDEKKALDLKLLRRDYNLLNQLLSPTEIPLQQIEYVSQGEGKILDLRLGNSKLGLTTSNAGPCLILALSRYDANGKLIGLALAHIDRFTDEKSIIKFMQMTASLEPKGQTMANVYSGVSSLALKTLNVLRGQNAEIGYLGTDLRELYCPKEALTVSKSKTGENTKLSRGFEAKKFFPEKASFAGGLKTLWQREIVPVVNGPTELEISFVK